MANHQGETEPIIVGHTIYAFKDGGMERGLLNLINYGDSERFRHVILCLTEAGVFANYLRSPSCEVVELHKRPGNDPRVPRQIAAEARRCRLDVLHARGWPTLIETAVAAYLSGVRRMLYGFHGKTMEDLHGLGLRRWLLQKFFIRFYHRVVTLNARMRLEFALESGLPEHCIHVIANGVDTGLFRPHKDRRALRVALGLPTERLIIGNVARLDPVKNHHVILRALNRVWTHPHRPLFLLVGEGPQRSALEQDIAALHLSGDVRLYGYSDRVPELLNCMDIYIQSSFYEGFSNTVLEAMACGLPVLATDTGGTKDLFREGQEGYFFRPDDDDGLASLISQLQCDIRLRWAMAERSRGHAVENFSVHTMVRNYEALYQDLVSSTSKPG